MEKGEAVTRRAGVEKMNKSAEGKPGKQREAMGNMGFTRGVQGEHWYTRLNYVQQEEDMGVRDRGSRVRVQEVKHKVKKVRH